MSAVAADRQRSHPPSGIVLYGAEYSVYTRIARIVLAEKGVAHTLRPIDIFDTANPDPAYASVHPFGKIPALDDGGTRLYETGAIARYLDEAHPGPALQPADPRMRARMNQVVSIVDAYAYPSLIWQLVVERLFAPQEDRAADEQKVAAGIGTGRRCLAAIADLALHPYLTGVSFTLADAWLAPVIAYVRQTEEGVALLQEQATLARWWDLVATRPSLVATRYPAEGRS
jgi:glutathione S-transferase